MYIRLLSYSSTILFVCLIDCLFVWLFVLLLSSAISCILHAVCLVGLIQQITQVCLENCEKDKGSAFTINMLFEFKKYVQTWIVSIQKHVWGGQKISIYHQLYAKWFPSSTQFHKFASQFWDWKHVWMSSTEDWNNEEFVDCLDTKPKPTRQKDALKAYKKCIIWIHLNIFEQTVCFQLRCTNPCFPRLCPRSTTSGNSFSDIPARPQRPLPMSLAMRRNPGALNHGGYP